MPPRPPFPSWLLRGLGDEPLLVQTFDAPRDPGWDVLHPMFPIAYLDRWLEQAEGRTLLYDMHATPFGPLAATRWAYGEEHLSLRPALIVAFERGDLVALVPRRRNAQLPGQPEVPIEPPVRPPTRRAALSFYELVLLDENEVPLVGVDIEMTTPAGAKSASAILDPCSRWVGFRTAVSLPPFPSPSPRGALTIDRSSGEICDFVEETAVSLRCKTGKWEVGRGRNSAAHDLGMRGERSDSLGWRQARLGAVEDA